MHPAREILIKMTNITIAEIEIIETTTLLETSLKIDINTEYFTVVMADITNYRIHVLL